jgi:hypothetical protein
MLLEPKKESPSFQGGDCVKKHCCEDTATAKRYMPPYSVLSISEVVEFKFAKKKFI